MNLGLLRYTWDYWTIEFSSLLIPLKSDIHVEGESSWENMDKFRQRDKHFSKQKQLENFLNKKQLKLFL